MYVGHKREGKNWFCLNFGKVFKFGMKRLLSSMQHNLYYYTHMFQRLLGSKLETFIFIYSYTFSLFIHYENEWKWMKIKVSSCCPGLLTWNFNFYTFSLFIHYCSDGNEWKTWIMKCITMYEKKMNVSRLQPRPQNNSNRLGPLK